MSACPISYAPQASEGGDFFHEEVTPYIPAPPKDSFTRAAWDIHNANKGVSASIGSAIFNILKLPGDFRGHLASFDDPAKTKVYDSVIARLLYSRDSVMGRTARRLFMPEEFRGRELTEADRTELTKRSMISPMLAFGFLVAEQLYRLGANIYVLTTKCSDGKCKFRHEAVITIDSASATGDIVAYSQYIIGLRYYWNGNFGDAAATLQKAYKKVQISNVIRIGSGISRVGVEVYDYYSKDDDDPTKRLNMSNVRWGVKDIGSGIFQFIRTSAVSAAALAQRSPQAVARAFAIGDVSISSISKIAMAGVRYGSPIIDLASNSLVLADAATDESMNAYTRQKTIGSAKLGIGGALLTLGAVTFSAPAIPAIATIIAIGAAITYFFQAMYEFLFDARH